ncbi:MAG TPA: AsmA-like C-terminal region-containing protein [Steroidobacteraceae bacterium]
MSVGVTPAEPAAGPAALTAGGAEARPARAGLRLAAWVLGGAAILGAVVLIAGELAAARVPQHRAALEELIRHQTGLDVSFSELSVRWGWYGPEAVFHGVVLGEPGGGGALLRAPQLIVGLDAWRMVHSAQLEAGRITLVSPDIDLGTSTNVRAGARSTAARPEPVLGAGARLLSRWRGGRIDLEGGTLRWPVPGAALPLTVNVRHVQLRRLGSVWNADAQVLLPASLGASAHLALAVTGDPARPDASSGTLSFEGLMLEFAAWREVIEYPGVQRYLPQAGRGNLELHTEFAAGRMLRADGKVLVEALEWRAPVAGAAVLSVDRLRGAWQLERRGAHWRFEVRALEFGESASAPVTASVDAATDGTSARGTVQSAPLPVLAAIARWYAPQLPLAQLALGGMVRELAFDWNAHRPAGVRLRSSAQLEDVTLATPARDVVLTGLTGHVSEADQRLVVDLQGHAAQLTLAREQPFALDNLAVAARLAIGADGGGWQVSSDDLEIRRADMSFAASGAIAADAAGPQPQINAHVALKDADLALLAGLLGPRALAALGAAATRLTAGRIENADLEWRGPLDPAQLPWSRTGTEFRGALELRGATLAGFDPWPEIDHLDARIEWRGPRIRAAIDRGQAGTFQLAAASAEWDVRAEHATHLAARLSGSVQQALTWLREHPQLAAYAPRVQDVDLRGDTLLDVDVLVPAAARTAAAAGTAPPVRTRVTAVLDGVQLRPVAGLPPIDALRGTLGFSAGHLQPSTLTGQWLGGPVTLGVGERREAGLTALAISGRGLVDVRQAVLAAGAGDDVQLAGNTEWSALLTFLPGADTGSSHWHVRADSNLIGVTSGLPEPFAKAQGTALPLHVEVQADADAGQLRLSLGERLRAWAALNRSGELWRIERGAVRLAATAPMLPPEPVLLLEGRLSRLDLPAYLALWQQAGRDAALPALRARLSTAQLVVGARSYPEVSMTADASTGGGQVQLQSADVSGTARWPAVVNGAHPALVHLARFNVAQITDTALGAGLVVALGRAAILSIDDLQWQGRSLGSFGATLAAQADGFDVSELHLAGDNEDTRGTVHCRDAVCRLQFSLDSRNAAATLVAFGFRPDLDASRARLQGELQWPQQASASLATLDGRLHMQLEQGATRAAGTDSTGVAFALLAVPALTAGMSPEDRDSAQPALNFSRLTADFVLRDGQATTSDLHFDGDAEILVRGRIGLLAHDYDEQAWILRGEERLPAAVRRFGPTPKVAAVWLSLRELFTGWAADRSRATLRLRGTWDDPLVTPAE